jgi:acyl carrier protein
MGFPSTRSDEMSNEGLKEQLRALVAEIAEKDEIPDGATFKELGIDSMMGVEIVAAIERQYHIKIEDDELAGFKDLGAAYDLVVRKLEAKSANAAAE